MIAEENRATSAPYRFIVAAGIAYMMLRPVGHGEILYPVLAVVAVLSLGAILVGRQRTSTEVSGVICVALVIAIYGTVVGAQNPGVEQHATVWFLGTLVFGVWALGADERMIKALMFASAWATICLSALILLYVGAQTGIIPSILPSWLMDETNAGFNVEDGSTAIRLYGLSTLVAAAPMWVVASLVQNHPLLPKRVVRVIAAVLAVGASIVGGRNAIVVVLVIVPIVIMLVRRFGRRGRNVERRAPRPGAVLLGAMAVIAIPVAVPLMFSNAAIQKAWGSVVDYFSGNSGQEARVDQSAFLIDAWLKEPITGNGFGAVIQGFSRSEDRPWNFELQYHMYLFQTGLVGVVLGVLLVGLAIRAIVRGFRARRDLAPVFLVSVSAALAMVIANATNPYLQAPGHMWSIWLPLMVANVALLRPKQDTLDLPPNGHGLTDLSIRQGLNVSNARATGD